MGYGWRVGVTFPDFAEFIASLNAHRVRYLIVGGYAVGFHARPRATKDIDVLIDRSASNAARARVAITAFLKSEAPSTRDEGQRFSEEKSEEGSRSNLRRIGASTRRFRRGRLRATWASP
jgi:hypothetical protein